MYYRSTDVLLNKICFEVHFLYTIKYTLLNYSIILYTVSYDLENIQLYIMFNETCVVRFLFLFYFQGFFFLRTQHLRLYSLN